MEIFRLILVRSRARFRSQYHQRRFDTLRRGGALRQCANLRERRKTDSAASSRANQRAYQVYCSRFERHAGA
jgi:hypothetical protein